MYKIIEAPDGKLLTQNTVIPNSERVFSKQIILGYYDNINNWREATDKDIKEHQTFLEELEKLKQSEFENITLIDVEKTYKNHEKKSI